MYNPVDDAVEIQKASRSIRDSIETMVQESDRIAQLPRVTEKDAREAAAQWAKIAGLLNATAQGVAILSEYAALKSAESQSWAEFVAEP